MSAGVLWTRNGVAAPLDEVPLLEPAEFERVCLEAAGAGARLVSLFAVAPRVAAPGGAPELLAALADDDRGRLALLRMRVSPDSSYPALTPHLPQAQAFERELYEDAGIRPDGHPWLKPLRRHAELEGKETPPEAPVPARPHPFFRVEGSGVHEVAVGPVHAGIIEPGHFRFQCLGERVLHLEIQLGYQHRGAEALLLRSTPTRRLIVAESVAGDTAVGHGLAHVAALEALAGREPPLGAQAIRGIALELERVANHVGDLGALCGDVGHLTGAAWFGRLRGEILNLLMELSGNRFGRGLLRLGGVRFGIAVSQKKDLLDRLEKAGRDIERTAALVFEASSVASRFEHTGVLSRATALELGIVGPAARASGCDRDVRRDHPSGIFRFAHVPVAVAHEGDVMARALVRRIEVQRSLTFVQEQIGEWGGGELAVVLPSPRPRTVAVSLVEAWRGEIAHVAVTGDDGGLVSYKIVDPSFHNWLGLALAMRDGEISDFPLCNKSFNLSYAGHDL